MRQRRVVGIGLCVIDQLFVIDDFSLREKRLRFRERRVSAGGMVSNALAQASALGCTAQLLSMVGDDPDGRLAARELRACGVRTNRLVRSPRFATTVALILVGAGSGERRLIVPDRRALERAAPEFDLSSIDARTIVLVDGHFPAQALRAVRRARRVGATVIADFNRPSRANRRLLPYVDYPIVPREFASALGTGNPSRTVRRLHEEFGGTPVVTLGGEGGVYLDGGRIRRYRARRVKVRDTTGAGDVFHGAFAAGLHRGGAPAEALELAARAAALNCTALGARGRLMTLRDLESR